MVPVSWLRSRSRHILLHTAIVAGFLLFLVFAAESLFGQLERIPGEAQVCQLEPPAETNMIRFNIDAVAIQEHTIELRGWAFLEGYDTDLGDSRTYVVLKSDTHTYVFTTSPRERPAVTAHFAELGLNLDWAGFFTIIPLRSVASGEYGIGLWIIRGDAEALQYTGRVVDV